MRSGTRAALAAATGAVLVSIAPLPPALAASCFGETPTLIGTAGRDKLKGTPGPDVIVGLGGSDLLRGFGGDDLLCGGPGGDLLKGEDGDDLLDGSQGGDVIEGGDGDDRLLGSGGTEVLLGGDGNDRLAGGKGRFDLLRGNSGNDRLAGGKGFDLLMGEGGNDRLNGGDSVFDVVSFVYAPGGVTVDLTAGRASGDGEDVLRGIEDVEATRFDDTVIGGATQNFITPLGGNDSIDGRGGLDQVLFRRSQTAVTVDLAAGTATGEGSDALTAIEGVQGSPLGDTIAGDGIGNYLFGAGGDDRIGGAEGDDILDGDVGGDTGDGGEGTDSCANFENGDPPPNCESMSTPGRVVWEARTTSHVVWARGFARQLALRVAVATTAA